jgi:hypothetical protein
MARSDVHVTWREDRPRRRGEGGGQPGRSLHEKKDAAEQAGRRAAITENSELLIHGKDGKIQERNTFSAARLVRVDNNEHRRLVSVVVSHFHDAERPAAQRNQISGPPIGYG